MSALTLEQFNQLVTSIYEAGLDTGRWQNVLNTLEEHLGAVRFGIQGFDLRTGQIAAAISKAYDPDYVDSYVSYYAAQNPWIVDIQSFPVGVPVDSDLFTARDRLEATEFYNDWILPQEDISFGAGLVLFRENDRSLIFSSNVRRRDAEMAKPLLLETLALLAPHIQRAFHINRTLLGAQLANSRYREALDTIANAVFLLDRRGRISHPNRAAERLLRLAELVYLDPEKRLRFADQNADTRLFQAIGAIAAHDFTQLDHTIAINRKDRMAKYVGTVVPFRPSMEATGLMDDFLAADLPVAMLSIMDPEMERVPSADALSVLYQLTPAEVELTSALARGQSLQEFADANSRSIHTVRNQLKSIFHKTGTSKQGELIALVGTLAR